MRICLKLPRMSKRSNSSKSILIGLIAAFGIAAVTVGGSVILAIQAGNRIDLTEEGGVLLFQIVWVAAPFVALSLAQVRAKRAWVAGVVVTLMFWSAYLASAYLSHGGGANIGMGLLMLASPLITAAAAFGASALRSRK